MVLGEPLALVLLVGLVATPGRTARGAYIPDLPQLGGIRLERVAVAADGSSRVAGFIGAPVAGVLIALVGTSSLLWIDAATFGFSALLIGVMVPASHATRAPAPPAAESAPTTARPQRFFADLSLCVRFLRRDRVL